jgi:hypothetical protein
MSHEANKARTSKRHFLGARYQHPPVYAPHCMCGGIVWARYVCTNASTLGRTGPGNIAAGVACAATTEDGRILQDDGRQGHQGECGHGNQLQQEAEASRPSLQVPVTPMLCVESIKHKKVSDPFVPLSPVELT